MSIIKWFKEEFRKDKRRFKKHPQVYLVLYMSAGLGVFVSILGLLILERPSIPGYVYNISYETGFWLFIVGIFWVSGVCIVGALFDKWVDRELEEENK
jgi:hypothetical protein